MKTSSAFKLIIIQIVIILFSLITYKTMIRPELQTKIQAGLSWEHKTNYDFVLSADTPEISEVVKLDVPSLFNIYITGKVLDADSEDFPVLISVTDASTGEILSSKTQNAYACFGDEDTSVKIKLKNPAVYNEYILTVAIQNPGNSKLILSSNIKPGIVSSVNGDETNKTNIITKIKYSSFEILKPVFLLILAAILIFITVSYCLIGIIGLNVTKFFLPVIFTLGLCYQILIPVGGTPDESWHIDTAYKYSNILMFVGETGEPGTIYKRKCDVIQSDMLGNNIESNSYYQLINNAFKAPDETELVVVPFSDTSGQVPGIVYIPAALGITIGRLLGLSSILTYVLGRIIPLLFFALITSLAIKLTPYGKNIFALVSLLPITLQQAGSMSYDSMIICTIFLYIAIVLRFLSGAYEHSRLYLISGAVLAVIIGMSKGGAYSPIILIALIVPYSRWKKSNHPFTGFPPKKGLIIALSALIIMAIFGVIIYYKYGDILRSMNVADRVDGNTDYTHYTISYFIMYPKVLFALLWNTPIAMADAYFLGLFGGIMGWNSVKAGSVYILPFIILLLLMANIENDKITENRTTKCMLLVPCVLCTLLIMAGLLLGNTEAGSLVIEGVQGRYFLPFTPLLLMIMRTPMISVNEAQLKRMWSAVPLIHFLFIVRFMGIVF